MLPNLDRPQRHLASPSGVTRRSIVGGAGASAFGALLLNNLVGGSARGADAHEKGHAEKTGGKKPSLKGPNRPTCVAIFPTAEGGVVTSDDDGKLTTYSFGNKNSITSFRKQHDGKASYIAVAAKARRAVTAGYDGKAVVRDPFGSDAPIAVLNTHAG